MSAVPTVQIHPCEQHQCPGHAFVEINASDFDPAKGHVLYGTEPAKDSAPLAADAPKRAGRQPKAKE